MASRTILQSDLLEVARQALLAESDAIRAVAERIDDRLLSAVDVIGNHTGKVVLCGVGKSGHIGQKIAATFCSVGVPAVFIHATDAVHGDLGVYTPGDPTILISKSGSTAEVLRLVPILQQFQSVLIAIVGNLKSPLARVADIVLDSTVAREADPLNLAPTCSSTVALAVGDALASALMHAKSFSESDFARCHPAGQIGCSLLSRVCDVMHVDDAVAWIEPTTSLRDVIVSMTQHALGAACVVNSEQQLEGLITDGDLRRALLKNPDILQLTAQEIMHRDPVTVTPQASLKEAATLMEDRPSQLSILPVVDGESRRCVGLVRIHDVYQAELA